MGDGYKLLNNTIGILLDSEELNKRLENVIHAAVATGRRQVVEMLADLVSARTSFADGAAESCVAVVLHLVGEKEVVGALHDAIDYNHLVEIESRLILR